MTKLRTAASLLVVGILLALAGVPAGEAQTRSLYWERYDVDITVLPDGDLRVVETQVINFTSGTFREGFAELSATNSDLIFDITLSEDGQPYTRRGSTSGLSQGQFGADRLSSGNMEVVWNMGPTQNQTRSFELAYTVRGAIRRYAEGNEFQWNAISPGMRDFEVRASEVTVSMPDGAGITYADYLVPPEFNGVPMDVQVSDDGLRATWVAQGRLAPSQGIQVVVQFPPNTVGGAAPSWQAAFDRETVWVNNIKPWVDIGLLVLGLITLFGGPALLYLLWYVRGRDPAVEAVPEYITKPPDGVPPGIAGTLVDEKADIADVIATMMDLAQRGYLVIEETAAASSLTRLGGKTFTLHQTDKKPTPSELNPVEIGLYNALVGSRTSVKFSELNQKFYTQMPRLQKKLYETAVQQGHFGSSPETVRGRYAGLGLMLLMLAFVGGFMAVIAFGSLTATILCPFMAAGMVAVVALVVGRHMPAKTRKGAEAAAMSRAFKTYLANLDKYADPKMVTEQFEKYLPYAIAFGLERSWINRFKHVPETPVPGWYYPVGMPYTGIPRQRMATGTTGGTARTAKPVTDASGAPMSVPNLQSAAESLSGGLQGMSDGLNNMLNSASRTLTSTPPSSSSSYGGTSSGGRSFSGGSRGGGGFRSSGGSGGGGRGFR